MSIVAEAAVSFCAVIMHNLNASTNPLWIFFSARLGANKKQTHQLD